jgi:hypothetical protein
MVLKHRSRYVQCRLVQIIRWPVERQIAPITAQTDTEYTNYTQQEVLLLHLSR